MNNISLEEQVRRYQRTQTQADKLENKAERKVQSQGITNLAEQGRRIYELARANGRIVDDEPPEELEVCPVCGGRGQVSRGVEFDHLDFGKLFPCPAKCDALLNTRREQFVKRVDISQLPDLQKGCTFEGFDKYAEFYQRGKMIARMAAEAFVVTPDDKGNMVLNVGHEVYMDNVIAAAGEKAQRNYSPDTRNSLVFLGPMGKGKTGLAAAIVNYLMEQGEPCLYMRCRDMISDVMRERKTDDDTLEKTIMDFPVLLIDEANIDDHNPTRDQFMQDLIRHRYAHRLATIVTCNIDEDGWEREWGGRTTVALQAMAHWIPLDGEVLRES